MSLLKHTSFGYFSGSREHGSNLKNDDQCVSQREQRLFQMNQVPVEILHQIFIKLDLKNRLVCTLFYRFWYDTLDQSSLFYNLDISTRQMPKLEGMIKRFPHRGMQIESLELLCTVDSTFDKRIFFNLLPNLQELVLKGHHVQNTRRNDSSNKEFHFLRPTIKLERMVDFGQCELTRQLVMSHECDRLKSLVLNVLEIDDLTSNHVVSKLSNMPMLESLRLKNVKVKLMDLETMHNNVPSIRDVQLENTKLVSGEIFHNVTPVTFMTELKLFIKYSEDLHPSSLRLGAISFLEELVQSQQSNYIRKLTLVDTVPEQLNLISHMKALEALEMDSKAIETHFLNLSTLELEGVITSSLTLSLPSHSKVQYYVQRRDMKPYTLRNTIPISKDEFNEPLVLHIICASMEHISFSAFPQRL
ncbi:hypothetical protein K501DRAFT_304700 [Backusella circina FSU 941]|nr:hypothetical protein K501DRAFT_304700 [Backusella circina FSU 941]